MATDDDLRELRTDVKSLLTQVAQLSQKIDDNERPCSTLKSHLDGHVQGRGAFVWVMQYVILPTVAAVAAYAAAIFGIGKPQP